MMRIWFAKNYSRLYGFFHDRLNMNIRGLGFFLRRINRDTIVYISGSRLYVNALIGTSYARLIGGEWAEPETHIFLNNVLEQLGETIFIDVGANVGEMVLGIQSHKNTQFIYAIEPDPTCASVIKVNCLLNGIEKCNVLQVALSDRPGEFVLSGAGTPQAVLTLNSVSEGADDIIVPVTTLDKLLSDGVLSQISGGSSVVTLIDVEGSEPNVLAGAKRFLSEMRPLIIFEYNLTSKNHFNLGDIESALPAGYRIFRLNRRGQLDADLQNTWNCVALDIHSAEHNKIIANQSSQ